MKKNLRIVSAAAAALLAVAPVAASTVNTATVQAADNNISLGLNGSANTNAENTVNVSSTFSLYAPVKSGNNVTTDAKLDGKLTASLNNNSVSASLANAAEDVTLTSEDGKTKLYSYNKDTKKVENNLNNVVAGTKYNLNLAGVGFSFGEAMKGKTVSFKLADGATLTGNGVTTTNGVANVTLDQYGNATGLTYTQTLTAYTQNNNAVSFINKSTGVAENSGNVYMVADNNGKLTTTNVVNEIEKQYQAIQYAQPTGSATTGSYTDVAFTTTANDVGAELKKAGIDVNNAGEFTAPKSFTVTMTAKSTSNGKSSTLPVTVTVPNGKDTTEASVSAKVMYKSAVYNKDLKTTGKTIAGYTDTNFVAENGKLKEFTINGEHFYKIANEDGYVRARNVTGSKMTLKKNAYVYKSNGKRTSLDGSKKITKGTEVTVYGGEYKAIKGYKGKAVRVGVNKYIKVANVNYDLYK